MIKILITGSEGYIGSRLKKALKKIDESAIIFYIDLRAGGKGFREYIERGQKEYGIKYIKGKVAKIIEDDDKNPIIIYEDMNTSKMKKFPVDLVILATSMIPNKDTPELANILGIDLDKNNFFLSNAYLPLDSSKKGIYICGCCRGPMDIPNSVIDFLKLLGFVIIVSNLEENSLKLSREEFDSR